MGNASKKNTTGQSDWVVLQFSPALIWPKRPCCYVVYMDGKLVYIGQTNDLSRRVAGHKFRP